MKDNLLARTSAERDWDAFRIAGLYLLTGCLWILFSDRLAAIAASDTATLARVGTLKGFGYVFVTTLLLYWLIRRHTSALRARKEQLRLAEVQLRILSRAVEQSPASTVITNTAGEIEYVNPKFTQLTGYTLEEVRGKNPRILKSGETPVEEYRSLWRNITAGQEWRGEFHNRKKDGELYWELATISPIVDEAGIITHFLAVKEDVTERKRAEERLHIYTAKLEQSNRELQDFASVASHDLQEPLRKIQTFGDRLAKHVGDSLDEQSRDYLARMQNAAARMSTLINDLLTFSRVTTKAQPFSPVDLARVTAEVLSDLEVSIERVGGRVEVGDLPIIEVDSNQMRQLLQNLIGNALKFRRPGEPPVVRVRGAILEGMPMQGDGSFSLARVCQLSVEDNGIGFDEKYLDRIFNIFEKLHGRGEYEGTGIGLAICRKIAERHGGCITATSSPGQGSTFIVTLPVRQQERAADG